MVSLANHKWPCGDEVEVINEALMGKVVEVQFWKRKWDFWKFKTLWLHEEGKENREKGKREGN